MEKEMRCAVFTKQRTVELQHFPIPEVEDDKILVRIEGLRYLYMGAKGVYRENSCKVSADRRA
mgnify:CR=1 FL=1